MRAGRRLLNSLLLIGPLSSLSTLLIEGVPSEPEALSSLTICRSRQSYLGEVLECATPLASLLPDMEHAQFQRRVSCRPLEEMAEGELIAEA